MTPEQQAARAVGMSHGIPEEFAIDCKAIVITPLEMAGVRYKPKDTIQLYDSRKRDRLRRVRAIMVTSDAWMKQPGPATLPPAQVETEGTHHGNDTPQSPAPAEAGSPEEGSGDHSAHRVGRLRRVKPAKGDGHDLR